MMFWLKEKKDRYKDIRKKLKRGQKKLRAFDEEGDTCLMIDDYLKDQVLL